MRAPRTIELETAIQKLVVVPDALKNFVANPPYSGVVCRGPICLIFRLAVWLRIEFHVFRFSF